MNREELLTDMLKNGNVPTCYVEQVREWRDSLKESREKAEQKREADKVTAYKVLHDMLTNEEQTASELYRKFWDNKNARNRYGKIITSPQKVRYVLNVNYDMNPRNCDYEIIRANREAMTFKLRG